MDGIEMSSAPEIPIHHSASTTITTLHPKKGDIIIVKLDTGRHYDYQDLTEIMRDCANSMRKVLRDFGFEDGEVAVLVSPKEHDITCMPVVDLLGLLEAAQQD